MTLNSIKNALFAAMHGMTPEEYELQKARDNLKSVTDNFLDQHPELLKLAPADTPTGVNGAKPSRQCETPLVLNNGLKNLWALIAVRR